jgi:hypothetical protein
MTSKSSFRFVSFRFSVFLGNIKSAFDKNESLESLLLDDFFTDAINKCQQGWRKVIATATVYGIPIPCLSTGKQRCSLLSQKFTSVDFSLGLLRWLSIKTFTGQSDSGDFPSLPRKTLVVET